MGQDQDYLLECIKRIQAIVKKYHLTPEAEFKNVAYIAGANYIRRATDSEQIEFPKKLDQWSHTHDGLFASFTIKGVLADLRDQGVTRENASEYIENRIGQLERDAQQMNRPS